MDAMQGFDVLRGGLEDGLIGVAGVIQRRFEARSLHEMIERYNALVVEKNANATQYNALLARHRALIDGYNELIDKHNELARRVNALEGR